VTDRDGDLAELVDGVETLDELDRVEALEHLAESRGDHLAFHALAFLFQRCELRCPGEVLVCVHAWGVCRSEMTAKEVAFPGVPFSKRLRLDELEVTAFLADLHRFASSPSGNPVQGLELIVGQHELGELGGAEVLVEVGD
jgi:hypothetical protein